MTKRTFESAMEQLETIMNTLERGEAPLAESIELYKKGMELSAFCKEQLDAAERQLMTVVDEQGNETTISEENK